MPNCDHAEDLVHLSGPSARQPRRECSAIDSVEPETGSRPPAKPRRERNVLIVLAFSMVVVAAGPNPGCGGPSEESRISEETRSGRELARRVSERLAAIQERTRELPQGRPDQIAAHAEILRRLTPARLRAKASTGAGLGTIQASVFDETMRDLDEVERLLDAFPR